MTPIARQAAGLALGLAMLGAVAPARALTFVIQDATPFIYLRVGAAGGGTSLVTFDLSGAQAVLGNGTPIYGTVDASAGSTSGETANFPACPANHVRIVARVRSPGSSVRTGMLQVTSSAAMVHAATGNTIPFTEIGWDSDDATEFVSGTFTGGTQVLDPPVTSSRETGACHRFKFLNTQVFPASFGGSGFYQGSVTYNLNSP